MLLAFYVCKVTHFILNNQIFSLFFMNNPKELDFRNRTFAWYWRKGGFKQIHEWYNHQGLDAVDGDDFIHISEYLIQSMYG